MGLEATACHIAMTGRALLRRRRGVAGGTRDLRRRDVRPRSAPVRIAWALTFLWSSLGPAACFMLLQRGAEHLAPTSLALHGARAAGRPRRRDVCPGLAAAGVRRRARRGRPWARCQEGFAPLGVASLLCRALCGCGCWAPALMVAQAVRQHLLPAARAFLQEGIPSAARRGDLAPGHTETRCRCILLHLYLVGFGILPTELTLPPGTKLAKHVASFLVVRQQSSAHLLVANRACHRLTRGLPKKGKRHGWDPRPLPLIGRAHV